MFHNSNAPELKQQGALQAARDPHSKVTAEDAERTIVQQTKQAGGAAFHFDPNATPAEKAAQAHANVPDDFHHEKKILVKDLATDQDAANSTPDYDLPPATTAGVVAKVDQEQLNGQASNDVRYARDRTGWAPRFGDGEIVKSEDGNANGKQQDDGTLDHLDHQTWLEGELDEKWFGGWFDPDQQHIKWY